MKVKVRIAVAVGVNGAWGCAGWKTRSVHGERDMMELACENVEAGEARYWIEAEVDAPAETTVAGTVSAA